jgi:phytoene desaturase
MKTKVILTGSGFSGLASACFLAQAGFDVTLLEKNDSVGGRARKFHAEGFTFDMGPSWYWMPEVFEDFFAHFGKKPSDYYELIRLDPSYKVVWSETDFWDIPASYTELKALLESYEPGVGEKLDAFMNDAEYKYNVGMKKLVFNPSSNPIKHLSKEVITGLFKLQLLSSFREHAKKYFTHPKILSLMEFPVLFLGATAQKIPALYSLMNFADVKLGTFYPKGGMFKIIEGMTSLAESLGVKINTDAEVKKLNIENGKIKSVETKSNTYDCDVLLNTADYHHFEMDLLPKKYQAYTEKQWDKKTMAPSSLLFYLGVNKKIPKLAHHNLFFDEDLDVHSNEIYEEPKWPSQPLFYTCVPSITDDTVAPDGYENVFILIPIASNLKDDEETHIKYYDYVIDKLTKYTGTEIKSNVIFKRVFSGGDFKSEYNAYKGNAYGLANTLQQTAFLRPKIKSNKISNLYHAGQLTLPGPGMPPSLISGEIAAKEIIKHFN